MSSKTAPNWCDFFADAFWSNFEIVRLPLIYYIIVVYVSIITTPAAGKGFATHMSQTVIETQFGKLRGVLITFPNRNLPHVEAYLSLQYATVLGGELRFMPPTSTLEKWDGIRVALDFRPVCPQRIPKEEDLRKRMPLGRIAHIKKLTAFLEKQNEECLNLNIYVPILHGMSLLCLI